jgi:capsular polysaccharide biosynthesis protein
MNEKRPLVRVSLLEWARNTGESYCEISPGGQLILGEYGIFGSELEGLFSSRKANVFCGHLSKCTLFSAGGLLVTQDSFLVADGLTHRGYDIEHFLGDSFLGCDGERYLLRIASPARIVDQTCVFLGGSANFGHFLYEYLMRLAVIARVERLQRLPVVVYEDTPPRFQEFLDLAGIDASRRIYVPRGVPMGFASLWMPSCSIYRDRLGQLNIWPEALLLLRAQINKAQQARVGEGRTRLYFSRSSAGNKRLVNESELLPLLVAKGFQIIDPALLSAQDQIKLVSNAEIIWCPLGAASAISMFAPDDCVVIEMVGDNKIFGAYNAIVAARVAGRPYHRIVGRRSHLPDNTRIEAIFADFEVDLDECDHVLSAALSRVGSF